MPSNYDNSAAFYDQLSRMVFGKALIKAQSHLLKQVPPNASVLIVGGGTGWILEELSNIHYSGLDITYVEISSRMTALAKKRNTGINKVTFINDAIENTSPETAYDVVITPFLLDSFTEDTLEKAFAHMHQQLKPKGLWLCTDFQLTGKLWQTLLLKSMYFFFRILCGIETMSLPKIDHQFYKHGYKVLSIKSFYGEFIISTRYQKP
ncbi:MAG: methyltransferase domain-containing protein [Mucilaginibacter sp.]|uniref:class I SAM-dependent methyltransferase n=1 Tax=Mucilaginibacter sp. TaxID=1882438 RepID=UPI0032637FE8